MSRKYNAENRLLNAYAKYLNDFGKKSARLLAKGYKPADSMALSFQEYVASRKAYSSEGVAAGNITNKIISNQLYQVNQATARNIISELKNYNITQINGKKISEASIRTGDYKAALSKLNEQLKAEGVMSSYERADWINENIFGDSE